MRGGVMFRTRFVLMAVLAVVVTPSTTRAIVRHVSSTGSCGTATPCYNTIQAAVDAAADNDEIRVAGGTYTGVQPRAGTNQVVYVSKSLTIRGGYDTEFLYPPDPAKAPTIVDAEVSGRAFFIASGTSVTVENFTIKRGSADGQGGTPVGNAGGGLFARGSSVILLNVTFTGNRAAVTAGRTQALGGGAFVADSATTISGCSFLGNVAVSQAIANVTCGGGGLAFDNASAFVDSSTIASNSANAPLTGTNAVRGGGLHATQTRLTLIVDTVTSNSAGPNASTNTTCNGGGIFVSGGSVEQWVGGAFAANFSDGAGGAAWISGPASIVAAQFMNNATNRGDGGALSVSGDIDLMFTQFTSNAATTASLTSGNGGGAVTATGAIAASAAKFILNTGNSYGGALRALGPVKVTDCSFTSNTAVEGGAINAGTTATLLGTMFVGNRAQTDGGAARAATGILGESSNFVSNSAQLGNGGALYCAVGNLVTSDTEFSDNTADGAGGAAVAASGNAWVRGSFFFGNSTKRLDGGAVYCPTGRLEAVGSVFLQNNSKGGGGGASAATVATTACVFDSNSAAAYGGGLYAANAALANNCVFLFNHAGTAAKGGGLCTFGSATVSECSFIENVASNGAGAFVQSAFNAADSAFSANTGGGAMVQFGPATIKRCYFGENDLTPNPPQYGAGLSMPNTGLLVVSDSEFTSNTAATGGGGIYAQGVSNVSDTRFVGNAAIGIGGGGAMSCGTTTTVERCTFEDNACAASGGALYTPQSLTLTDSDFRENHGADTSGYGGGAVICRGFAPNAEASISRARFVGNTAYEGGGVFIRNTNATLSNLLFTGNRASAPNGPGSSLYLYSNRSGGRTDLAHLTIADTVPVGGTALWIRAGTISIFDSIIANHAWGITNGSNTVSEDYNLFNGNTINMTGLPVTSGGHSKIAPPGFVDPASGDYHITATSAARDAGTDAGYRTDLDGDVRPWTTLYDIGMDEYISTSSADMAVTKRASPDPAAAGAPVVYTIVATNLGPRAATGVRIEDHVSFGVLVQSWSATRGECGFDSGVVWCEASDLACGESTTLTITVVAPSAPGTIVNTATVAAEQPDPTPANNTAVAVSTVTPPVAVWRHDKFTAGEVSPPGGPGWTSFGFDDPTLGWPDYSLSLGAYRCFSMPNPTRFRISGLLNNPTDWMPYSAITSGSVVRGRFFIHAGGQADPSNLNQIPNFRLRLCNRFAVNSMLEVFHHSPDSTQIQAMCAELRPSTTATSPSVYRVDIDPVDVPYLASNAAFEGVQCGFEAYAIYPEDQGWIALTELVLGTYPAAAVTPYSPAPKVYATDSAGPGDLGVFAPGELDLSNIYIPPGSPPGAFGTVETTGSIPTYAAGATGILLDTDAVPTDRIGVGTRNFNPDRGTLDFASHVRVETGRQYHARFHLTSTQLTNRQAQVRLRARSIKFGWSQKFEIGAAWGTDGGKTYPLNQNNSIAQQALPGVGCENPDRTGTETNGGWYTLILQTPMSSDIRPEFAAGVPVETRMPNISAQPGPGVAQPSRRDLLLGMDLVDTLSGGAGRFLERGNVLLDRIEVRPYGLIPD